MTDPRPALKVSATEIPEVKLVEPPRFGDPRGFFSEVYNRRDLAAAGIDLDFVQDNHALSAARGTVRGLHFQVEPATQAKLIRVSRGAVFDVAVDLRRGSPTFGRHVSAVLSADNWHQILVPAGFAHGYCTLEPDTEVLYKATGYYDAEHEAGLHWLDPDLAIDWPIDPDDAVVSDKDRNLPRLADAPEWFRYGG